MPPLLDWTMEQWLATAEWYMKCFRRLPLAADLASARHIQGKWRAVAWTGNLGYGDGPLSVVRALPEERVLEWVKTLYENCMRYKP